MFALTFTFPAGRYHATPWGRNVNEADVAWPPEPWRLIRTLIANWWRKADHRRWSDTDMADLVDALAERPPVYHLPHGAIHSHTRHFMPQGKLAKGTETTALVFDAFVHLPCNAVMVAAWPELMLRPSLFALASELAASITYLGRAESWTECRAIDDWEGNANCWVAGSVEEQGTLVRVLAPRPRKDYEAKRRRLLDEWERDLSSSGLQPNRYSSRRHEPGKAPFQSRASGADTLPERLFDALALDTSDYQDRGWSKPPAARQVLYLYAEEATLGVVPRLRASRPHGVSRGDLPTVARYLLAGRPLPRIEDAIKIGELMRRAALAKFGWDKDEATGRWIPLAPGSISGRNSDGRPMKVPSHAHAFWLPEDADNDGWIDHISVSIADGIDNKVRGKLDQIYRLWLAPRQQSGDDESQQAAAKEWRLALEGFGHPSDFAGSAQIFATSKRWQSVTPFLAAGHLKADGYRGEVLRLLQRRGYNAGDVKVEQLESILVGGGQRRPIHFHRFRSRGGERQPDAAGTLLHITFPKPVTGPLALGFGSHFGLGLFAPAD